MKLLLEDLVLSDTPEKMMECFTSCTHCGHGKNLHELHHAEPHCIYTDSEGPCMCGGFQS